MKRYGFLSALLVLLASSPVRASEKPPAPHPVTALTAIPVGLTLPVALENGLRAGRSSVAQTIHAVTTQRVLLPDNSYLPAGVHLSGVVERSSTDPDTLALRFSTMHLHDQVLPITVRALALANFTDVSDTALPAQGSPDRGNPSQANWTTQQVGGDEVVRSGWSGPVINATTQTVGFADFNGVYALPLAGSEIPRSLGPFSTSAHGLYGKAEDCTLHSPAAIITVTCTRSHLTLRRGDALLLEVTRPLGRTPVTP